MPKPLPTAPPGPPGSLAAALAAVPDPRHPNGWRPDRAPLPLVGLLRLAVAAMLCGARSLYAVAQWGCERVADDPAALVPLGWPPGRSPGVATLHRVFTALDVTACERALGDWLVASGVDPADALALDGKTLRGIQGDTVPGVHPVAADAHRAQTVVGQTRTGGKGHELTAAEALLATLPLRGRLITGDALLTQRGGCDRIAAGGGDDLLPVDENQPALLAAIAAAVSPLDRPRPGRTGPPDRGPVAGRRTGRVGRRADGGD